MSYRAKIMFFPEIKTTDYPMNNIDLTSKYEKWSMDTSDYATVGYIYTDSATSISTINSNYWVRFKPKTGYKFNSVHKTNSFGEMNMGEFTISDDGSCTVYPWNNGTAAVINNYLYFDVVKSTEITYSVTNNLTDCISDSDSTYKSGENITINLTCNDNFYFKDVPSLIMGESTLNFNLTDDNKKANINLTVSNNITVNATAIHTPNKLTLDLTNCTCNYSSELPYGKVQIILTAKTGYIFNDSVQVQIGDISYSYSNFTLANTVCQFEINSIDNVSIKSVCIEQIEQLSSFTNLYKVNMDILSELAKTRFKDVNANTVDYGTFINNLIKIPFEIPDILIGDNTDIQLGNYDSLVKAPIMKTYILTINIGNISVPEKYKNVYDYKDTICILHLPFSDNIILNTEYVINHTISVKYIIDLYSGNCTINITSDFTKEIVSSKTVNIAIKIPFIQEQNNSAVNDLKNIVYNGIKQAFIEVVRNIPYTTDNLFGSDTVDFGTLENYIGYIKVSNILLNINATNYEKEELEELLRKGVYINKNN